MSLPADRFVTVEEYLRTEPEGAVRHEYVDGLVYAMSGGSKRHAALGANFIAEFVMAARGSACRVFTNDLKVRATRSRYYYPDVMVSCDVSDDRYTEERPCLIVEVLSPSTEATDRREKLLTYLNIATLRHYLLVSQDGIRIEQYLRDGDGNWTVLDLGPGDQLVIDCPKGAFAVDEFYRDLPPPELPTS